MPLNEGRGYVFKTNYAARGMRHAQCRPGAQDPLMWRLAPTLVAEMGEAYSLSSIRAQALIVDTLKTAEETRFRGNARRHAA
jgi:alanyl-tRNA synthetase